MGWDLLCGEGPGLSQLYLCFVSLPILILCPNVSMDCQKRMCQVCGECAGDTDTTDESLFLSISPVWECPWACRDHRQLLSMVPTHCAGLSAREHRLEKLLLWSLLLESRVTPAWGLHWDSSAQGLWPLGCPAQGSLSPLAFPDSVHEGAASSAPLAAPAARSGSSSRSRSCCCLVWLVFLAFLFPPFPAGLAGCPQALAR